jgi:hypothetical protein
MKTKAVGSLYDFHDEKMEHHPVRPHPRDRDGAHSVFLLQVDVRIAVWPLLMNRIYSLYKTAFPPANITSHRHEQRGRPQRA